MEEHSTKVSNATEFYQSVKEPVLK